jgi:hypothetical protein
LVLYILPVERNLLCFNYKGALKYNTGFAITPSYEDVDGVNTGFMYVAEVFRHFAKFAASPCVSCSGVWAATYSGDEFLVLRQFILSVAANPNNQYNATYFIIKLSHEGKT